MTITSGTTGQIYEVYNAVAIVELPAEALGIVNLYIQNFTAGTLDIQYNASHVIDCDSGEGLFLVYDDGDNSWSADEESGAIVYEDGLPRSLYGNITFVYADENSPIHEKGKWLGFYDIDGDQFASDENKSYLVKGAGTYELHKGSTLNDAAIVAEILQASTGGGVTARLSKEFVMIRINTNRKKPKRVEFFETLEQAIAGTPVCFLDITTDATGLYLQDYGQGYEALVPRKKDDPFDRLQGRHMLYKLIYDDAGGGLVVSSVTIEYEAIK